MDVGVSHTRFILEHGGSTRDGFLGAAAVLVRCNGNGTTQACIMPRWAGSYGTLPIYAWCLRFYSATGICGDRH